eukprot:6082212-Amphidinium_carterae.1
MSVSLLKSYLVADTTKTLHKESLAVVAVDDVDVAAKGFLERRARNCSRRQSVLRMCHAPTKTLKVQKSGGHKSTSSQN